MKLPEKPVRDPVAASGEPLANPDAPRPPSDPDPAPATSPPATTPPASVPPIAPPNPFAPLPIAPGPVPLPPLEPPTASLAATSALLAPVGPETAAHEMRRLSRRSFAIGGIAAVGAIGGAYWLTQYGWANGIPWFLRKTLEFNARLAETFYKPSRLAPIFDASAARDPRVNGNYGVGTKFDPAKWTLRVEQPRRPTALPISIDQIKSLPRAEMITELKCIEGWSVVVSWAGARLADFIAHFQLGRRDPAQPASPENLCSFVALETPDREYYVGLDMASALHPQTLLCYELNGKPLPLEHGAPLRLVIPVKYGIKNIKRIGTIRFLDTRPADYWAEQGYDWYAGL